MKFSVKHPLLIGLIKYFWVIDSKSLIEVNHKLLPMSNIDLILNVSSPIKYIKDEKIEIVPNGLRMSMKKFTTRSRICLPLVCECQ